MTFEPNPSMFLVFNDFLLCMFVRCLRQGVCGIVGQVDGMVRLHLPTCSSRHNWVSALLPFCSSLPNAKALVNFSRSARN